MHLPPARKRFGQHFLVDNNIIRKIIAQLNLQAKTLIEIGPGQGALTKVVLEQVPHLNVVEIDRDLVAFLKLTYADALTIYEADALSFNFDEFSGELNIFGNLPYNISTPLLFHLLKYSTKIKEMIFMLQKEVVDRICAKPNTNDYGRLSVMIQYYCKTKSLFDISPHAFSPPPRVQSSIVKLNPYHDDFPHPLANDIKMFEQIVKLSFQKRRKILRNSLYDIISDEAWTKIDIDPTRRAETLTVSEFVYLSNYMTGI